MKSTAVQSSSKPYTGQPTADRTVMAPLTRSQPISGMGSSTVNASGGTHPWSSVPSVSPIYPPVRPTTVPQTTYLSPGPSIQAYPPQHSLSPGLSPPWRDPYPQSQLGALRGASPSSQFAPKTAAELGLLDRPDTSYEGMELSNIVDRMTSAFPLDVHSGIFFLYSNITLIHQVSQGLKSGKAATRVKKKKKRYKKGQKNSLSPAGPTRPTTCIYIHMSGLQHRLQI